MAVFFDRFASNLVGRHGHDIKGMQEIENWYGVITSQSYDEIASIFPVFGGQF